MPLISSSIPNLINGVSQQPAALRLASQAEEVINCMPSPVEGLKKRPPMQHIKKLFAGSAGTGRPFTHIVDRDGVINYDYGYVHNVKNFKFRRGVIKGLKYLTKKKYHIFIVTNQAGIGKKKFTLESFKNLNKYLKKLFLKKKISIRDVQYSPFHKKAKIKKYIKNSKYRKPGNLMIKKIFKNWDIESNKSFMIGDKKSDKLAAKKSNLKFHYAQPDLFIQIKNIINNY